ncbi:hypothetical protein [Psychrobacter sp. MES7-P7E]|uniref:hypothetical protein n=1 Tax=Psychrobacter sp. MES7-P7E TaxID=2058322 RepID=UPI000C7F4AD9|nr:hypothetical protein [Psychrobacter sp. MES7-P7E]PLT21148.1 hypothetical protein CXF62_11655 [Psychrobacter sp. MES7-P7E]
MLRLNHCIYIKQRVLWVFALILAIMTTAMAAETPTYITAETVVVVNKYGMSAPFLMSWLPVWIFALAGGIGANFIKIPEIDKHFRYLMIAKPFLGLFGGIALCLLVSDGSEPPQIALTAYALGAALLSAPILQAAIAVVTIPKNQAGFLNSVNPFKFKIVTVDTKEPTNGSNDD